MAQGIISIRELSFTYPGSNAPILQNIDLEIAKGDFVAVIGGNGSGKTTLCKAINGLIPQYLTGDFSGSVEVLGKNTTENSVASLASHVAYVYQDFECQLVRSTVYEDVIFAPMNFGLADYRERGMEAIRLIGLEHLKDRFIWELSGGQKHLAALAGVLSLNPEIIIVDEPAAQLDPANAVLIYEKLQTLNRDYGKTIIVIEHHTEFIADYCHSVILMDQGRLLWKKPVREALNRLDELKQHNIYPPQVTQAAAALCDAPYPIQIKESNAWFQVFNISNQKPTANKPDIAGGCSPIIEFQSVSHFYSSGKNQSKEVLKDIDLTIFEGDRIVIAGSNGAGKSTLLKLISGLTKPWSGEVNVCGTNTRRVSPEIMAGKVSYIFQNPEEMFIEDSVRNDIEYFLKARKVPDLNERVDGIVNVLQLAGIQDQNGRLLSGGQQRRASLAIGVASQPAVILLDEPTGSLDIASRREMVALLEYLREQSKTVIIATHDMQLAAEWANRMVVMKEGKILADSTPDRIFADRKLLEEANLKAPQVVELCLELGINPPALSIKDFSQRLSRKEDDNLGIYHEAVR